MTVGTKYNEAQDKIILTGMEFLAAHGALPDEHMHKQIFLVDVELFTDLHKAGTSDKLADTVNYAQVFEIARYIIEGAHHDLLESLAEEIAANLLRAFVQIQKARVTVHKPNAPLPGKFADAAISIVRTKNES